MVSLIARIRNVAPITCAAPVSCASRRLSQSIYCCGNNRPPSPLPSLREWNSWSTRAAYRTTLVKRLSTRGKFEPRLDRRETFFFFTPFVLCDHCHRHGPRRLRVEIVSKKLSVPMSMFTFTLSFCVSLTKVIKYETQKNMRLSVSTLYRLFTFATLPFTCGFLKQYKIYLHIYNMEYILYWVLFLI